MVLAMFHKLAFSGAAAAIAAGAGLIQSADVAEAPAYGVAAIRHEAEATVRYAAHVFERADLGNDGALDEDEYVTLAIVTAELARLNGFVAIDQSGGVTTVALPIEKNAGLTGHERGRVWERAAREYAVAAGDDHRLSKDEFIGAVLEQFLANDVNRNGVLSSRELVAFGLAQSRLTALES